MVQPAVQVVAQTSIRWQDLSAPEDRCSPQPSADPDATTDKDRAIPQTMRAMLFEGAGLPLRLQDVPVPEPGPGEVRITVAACGVCRTDLHIADGDLR